MGVDIYRLKIDASHSIIVLIVYVNYAYQVWLLFVGSFHGWHGSLYMSLQILMK